ncbi:MAG: hypothetical protein ACKVQC_05565 [Elusimicrobiota bacterium]
MVLAVRLDKLQRDQLRFISKKRHLNKTQAVKELLNKGFLMCQLDEYRSGHISLGKLAEILGISIFETMNHVAAYNAHPKIPGDYLMDIAETSKKLVS